MNNDSGLTESGITGNVGFDTGVALTGALGYQFEGGLRLEGELGYTKSDIDSLSVSVGQFTISTTAISGDAKVLSGMVNAIFDFPIDGNLKPYILGGLGITKGEVTIEGVSSDDKALAAQVGLGINYAVNSETDIGLSYRYFATQDYDFDGTEAEYSSHRILLGVRFNL